MVLCWKYAFFVIFHTFWTQTHENMRVRNGQKSGNLGLYTSNFFSDSESHDIQLTYIRVIKNSVENFQLGQTYLTLLIGPLKINFALVDGLSKNLDVWSSTFSLSMWQYLPNTSIVLSTKWERKYTICSSQKFLSRQDFHVCPPPYLGKSEVVKKKKFKIVIKLVAEPWFW